MIDDIVDKIFKEYDEYSEKLFGCKYVELFRDDMIRVERYMFDSKCPLWKPVYLSGVRTSYVISNTGLLRHVKSDNNIVPYINHKGYEFVSIYVGNYHHVTAFIHRLVANAFIPNPDNKPQVNHINGNKRINWVGNLEWNTAKENIQHALANNLSSHHNLGESANGSIYKNEDIHRVCKLLETKQYTNVEISKFTGVSKDVVSKVKIGNCWNHISSQYDIPTARRCA